MKTLYYGGPIRTMESGGLAEALISIDAKEQGIPALFFCHSQGIL